MSIDPEKSVTYSRFFVDHFVIGYFALFVIYRDGFVNLELYTHLVLAVVVSYLLIIPSAYLGNHWLRDRLNDEKIRKKIAKKTNRKTNRGIDKEIENKIYRYLYYRIFSALAGISFVYICLNLIRYSPSSVESVEKQWLMVIMFVFIALVDFIVGAAYYVKIKKYG